MAAVLCLTMAGGMHAQYSTAQRTVFTNELFDNWETSFGIEGLSFYSSKEKGLGLSKNPLRSYRANFGAAATIGKWFTPELGLRTKGSGYWGKAVMGDNASQNSIKFYSIQEHIMLNMSNVLMGYNPDRTWNVIPYAGAGFVRSCSYNENSIGAAFGIMNTFKVTNHVKIHTDMGLTLAGDNYKGNNAENIMGRYKYLSFEVGLTFSLGRSSWSRYVNRAGKRMNMVPVTGKRAAMYVNNRDGVDYAQVVADAPVPEDMVLVNRGHLRMGIERQDTLWGAPTPVRDISVDDFWMDKTEVTNSQYHEFIQEVCDTIIAQRMRDPYYQGDRSLVLESLFITNPVTGEKMLDARQMNFKYEIYDYASSVKRKYRLDPRERVLNTDIPVDDDELVMISKDTAYVDINGNIVQETINRPLSGPYDFLNTYIVNIYPDTTCWVNDFPNADNERYARYYFSHPDFSEYPVVGVTWEQANAYCAWRTMRMKARLGETYGNTQPFRLPTEAEWEYAARGRNQNEFPWDSEKAGEGKGMFMANYMPEEGDYTKDGNIITSRVGVYAPNTHGLYDMAGNVSEWTSTAFTEAGVQVMNNINPQLRYNASVDDPYRMKRKSVRGGSWKDAESHIMSAWRSAEYQNQPRSYIGFRCVRSVATSPSEKTVIVVRDRK